MKHLLFACCFSLALFTGITPSSGQSTGAFTEIHDIGSPKLKGNTDFVKSSQEYKISGCGFNMWMKSDQFHLASVKLTGDFILTVFCRFEGQGTVLHRKMGLIIREDLNPGSRYADAAVHGDGLTSLQYRPVENEDTKEVKASLNGAQVIQLERKGDTILMRGAKIGSQLIETGRIILPFKNAVYAGLFVCSHDPGILETATFSNFRIDVPAAENVNGYIQQSPSRLEILDVETGLRKVIFTTQEHIEAPNWSADGKYLIYNCNGLLYKFPLKTGVPEKINTGDVIHANNDHGLSFDGKMLAISSSTKLQDGKSGSMIYTVPVNGGQPKAITTKVPSYWHGWSPDSKVLVYCAERNGDYDVWGIPSKGGDEFQLTTSKGLDDGPEYSPDGKKIYFNSVRTGNMKIWRMNPDGSEQEQVSFGPLNDWFAHVSPDGKQMIYITFPQEVPAGSHPRNQRVTLQLQPTTSTEKKVLTYIYGGQGTMNVPSWSPDSKKVAFVSYTYGNPEW